MPDLYLSEQTDESNAIRNLIAVWDLDTGVSKA